MAAIKGRPVTITQVPAATYAGQHPNLRPEKLVVVGDLASTALTAVPASFADLAAVRTYLNTLVTELKSSPYFS